VEQSKRVARPLNKENQREGDVYRYQKREEGVYRGKTRRGGRSDDENESIASAERRERVGSNEKEQGWRVEGKHSGVACAAALLCSRGWSVTACKQRQAADEERCGTLQNVPGNELW
jgi:hypothetical protein